MSPQYEEIRVSPPDNTASCSGGRVLLVEDNIELRRLITEFLVDRDYSVTGVDSGPEALDFIRDGGEVDLVITDVVMPRMNGYDFAAHVRQMHPSMMFLFVSGYPADAVLRSKDRFLAKPFQMTQLGSEIREMLLSTYEPMSMSSSASRRPNPERIC